MRQITKIECPEFWEELLDAYTEYHYKYPDLRSAGMCFIVESLMMYKLGYHIFLEFLYYIREEFKHQKYQYDYMGNKVYNMNNQFIWEPDQTKPRIDYIKSKIKQYEITKNPINK
jgi:hypothetical protein